MKRRPAKVVVEASPRYELFAAFVTHKRSLSSVAPDVLFQVAGKFEILIRETL